MRALIDNDVLVKGSCFGLLRELAAEVSGDAGSGVLGAARFVVPKLIKKKKLRSSVSDALRFFEDFLLENEIVEPSAEEQRLAANLESTAQTLALNLDVGESQLTAVLILRSVPYLVTGDKRAILALEKLLDTDNALANLVGRVRCLEQLVKGLLTNVDPVTVQRAICDEPEVDKTLSICFSCSNPDAGTATVHEGLDSYVAALRAGAGRVLSM